MWLKWNVRIGIIIFFLSILGACKDDVIIKEVLVPDTDSTEEAISDSWILNSLQDISAYADESPTNEVTIWLGRNESEHFQIVLRTNGDCPVYPKKNEANENTKYTLRRIAPFRGIYDILIPVESIIYPENKEIRLWATYQTNPNSKPGVYEDTLYFKSMQQVYPVYVHINVKDVSLPVQSSFPAVFGIDPDNLPMAKGIPEESKIMIRKEVSDLLLNYRISPYFCSWISATNRIEVNSSPFPPGDVRMLDYLKDPRFNLIALPYRRLTDTQLRTMLEEIRNSGLIEKCYFYFTDEVRNIAGYNEIKTISSKIHGYAPEAKILITFNQGPDDKSQQADYMQVFDVLQGYVDIFCTGVTVMNNQEEVAAQIKAKLQNNEEWWTYVCLNNVPGMTFKSSSVASRAVMWRSWKEQADGSLFWVVNAFQTFSPLTQQYSLPPGDGILVYPGDPVKSPVSCVSIRLERWRDGAEDYELLRMIEQKSGREQALSLLNTVYQSPLLYTAHPEDVIEFKKAMLELLSQ